MPAAKSNKIVSVLLCILGFTYSFSLSAYERNHRLSTGGSNVSKADTMQLISNDEVKVVYFHGKGQLPFLGWMDRLDRTLKDVSRFYAEEFAKQGKFIEGIPFEMEEDERLKLHVVEGQKEASRYGIHSGAEIEREISASLAGTVDMDNDHVLVITALGYKNEDGSYVFHSPYYGRGGARSGLCIVVDCDLLDVKNLTDTVQSMSFSEMAVDGKQCSVAEFNSWYIGGIAHEMGHLFGLHHDFGHPIEWRDPSFISLMGQHGSRHYREDQWNIGRTSAFSRAGIEQLAVHPLFSRQSKPISFPHEFLVHAYTYTEDAQGAKLKLNYYSPRTPAQVVALIRPIEGSEYFNNSYMASLSADTLAEFDLPVFEFAKPYEVVLLFLWTDGTILTRKYMFASTGNAKLVYMQRYGNTLAEELKKELEKDRTKNKKELDIIGKILDNERFVDLDTYPDRVVSLSDAIWEEAYVGWEVPARNYFSSESDTRFFLVKNGQLYDKGLYAHSPSLYRFNVNGKWKRIQVRAGLRDGAHEEGGAQFHIVGDGKILASSAQLKGNETFFFDVDIDAVHYLELRTNDMEGHNHNSWAIWCDPILSK